MSPILPEADVIFNDGVFSVLLQSCRCTLKSMPLCIIRLMQYTSQGGGWGGLWFHVELSMLQQPDQ